MLNWKRSGWALAFGLITGTAFGQSHHHHLGGPGAGWGFGGVAGVAVGLGSGYSFPFYSSVGLNGVPFTYTPAIPLLIPASMAPMYGPLLNPPPAAEQRWGLAGPVPNLPQEAPPRLAVSEASRSRKADPAGPASWSRSATASYARTTFIARPSGTSRRSGADPSSATPRVRLAQVAFIRGQYSEAANRFREAMTTEPGWLINAPDIQSIYGEPSDFAKLIAKLESHVQAHPNDRDAWFLLGAQWYLSGQSRKASDVFLRLSDRQGDPALTAFLDASTPRHADPSDRSSYDLQRLPIPTRPGPAQESVIGRGRRGHVDTVIRSVRFPGSTSSSPGAASQVASGHRRATSGRDAE